MKNTVTQEDVNANMQDIEVRTIESFGKPMTVVSCRMKNGFLLVDHTTCVDPANYSEEIGKQICMEHIEDQVWKLLGYQLQTVCSAKNQELAKSVELMLSPDYKERFKAECMQLHNRIMGLTSMLEKWDKGELNFTPTCPREWYDEQIKVMLLYESVLMKRDEKEEVGFFSPKSIG